ncbi:MAG: TadE/TadG family type IV pilus assembly protein [Chloroflexota bacterium]
MRLVSGRSGRAVRLGRSAAETRPATGGGAERRRASGGRENGRRGQSLVEFALVLTPLFFVLLGIIQFGFIFNSYVTMTNSAREGARSGTVYIYNRSLSKDQNDLARNEAIRTAVTNSMNLLGKTAPHFTTSATWAKSGLVFTNGDIVVTYAVPSGITDTDARRGETITVRATYHMDLIVPIVSGLLPADAGGRLRLIGEVTMVVN